MFEFIKNNKLRLFLYCIFIIGFYFFLIFTPDTSLENTINIYDFYFSFVLWGFSPLIIATFFWVICDDNKDKKLGLLFFVFSFVSHYLLMLYTLYKGIVFFYIGSFIEFFLTLYVIFKWSIFKKNINLFFYSIFLLVFFIYIKLSFRYLDYYVFYNMDVFFRIKMNFYYILCGLLIFVIFAKKYNIKYSSENTINFIKKMSFIMILYATLIYIMSIFFNRT